AYQLDRKLQVEVTYKESDKKRWSESRKQTRLTAIEEQDKQLAGEVMQLAGVHVLQTQSGLASTNKLVFNTNEYKKFVNKRQRYILKFLEGGWEVLFTDVDTFWLRDPFPFLRGNFDLAMEQDNYRKVKPNDRNYCAGFVYFRPTERTLKFVREWIRYMAEDKKLKPDQVVMNHLIRTKKVPRLQVRVLNWDRFPNGKLFFNETWRRERSDFVVFITTGSLDTTLRWSGSGILHVVGGPRHEIPAILIVTRPVFSDVTVHTDDINLQKSTLNHATSQKLEEMRNVRNNSQEEVESFDPTLVRFVEAQLPAGVMVTQRPLQDPADDPRPVILATTNKAFLDFTANWLESIRRLDTNPKILIGFNTPAEQLPWDSPIYNAMVNKRPAYIYQLLQRGHDVLFSDVDTVWLRDPFPYLQGDFHVAVAEDQHKPYVAYCAGFVFFRAAEKTKEFVREWLRRLHQSKTKISDQVLMNEMLTKDQIPGLKKMVMPSEIFPNGKLFFMTPGWRQQHRQSVAVVHKQLDSEQGEETAEV
ncbi:uncharacterized protein LOC115925986, partial [Strongylocentrotus purpuratus]|uniref:Nucleotide-diphospho-sugar transferase domain-containing protein n=1 Tax=Strongylocentrotus purpuratus TaxID=7668 RepID=A0A7M7P6X6_STRPU